MLQNEENHERHVSHELAGCETTPISTTTPTTTTTTFVNSYLKKHQLDATLLPNKKIIKLSDWRKTSSIQSLSVPVSQPRVVVASQPCTSFSYVTLTPLVPSDIGLDKEDGECVESAFQDDTTLDELSDSVDYTSESSCANNSDGARSNHKNELVRKKREPSLKLKQKLSNHDLELIVERTRTGKAQVFIADIRKDNYIDKILRVKLVPQPSDSSETPLLSNGSNEALLKKSMFSKELTTLFDTFVNALCIQMHIVNENGLSKPILSCQVVDCGFKSFSEAEMMRHIKRHLAQDGYTCEVCSNQFASMTNLQRHLRIHNGNLGKELKCQHCDYKASTVTHIKRHMAHKHLERSLPCPHCPFMGATNAELKIHMARKHLQLTGKNPLFLPNYLRKDYECNLCTLQFNDFKEYQAHMYKHTSSSNRFQCVECPYNCKNFSKLKRHMLYHAGARNYSCDLCGNKFYQTEHLKRHMQSIHHQTSPLISQTKGQSENEPEKAVTDCSDSEDQASMPVDSVVQETANAPVSSQEVVDASLLNESNPSQRPLANSEPTQPSYIVTSKCTYKCQKCDYTTSNLYTLNEHAINQHTSECSELAVPLDENGQEEHANELDDEFEEENDFDEEDEDDDESNDEYDDFDEILNEMEFNVYGSNSANNLNFEAKTCSKQSKTQNAQDSSFSSSSGCLSFRCSFCSYRSNKKTNLKVKKALRSLPD